MLDDSETQVSEVAQKMCWQFIAEHYETLMKICVRAARGDLSYAEELMSDEIYRQTPKLLRSWDQIRPFPTYAFNHFRLHLRKISARRFIRKHEVIYEETHADAKTIGPSEQSNKLEVEELLARLTELEKSMVTFVVMHGYTYREVELMFGCSNSYVHKVVKRAMEKLRGQT